MSHVFISYARKDGREHADRLAAALSAAGYQPWLDRRGIDPAKDFTGEIESAIRTASHVVVCITPDTKRPDSFVRREVQHALMLGKPIYVAKVVAGALPPIHINTHTYFTFCDDWEASFAGLREHLARPAASYRPPAPAAPAHPLRPYVQRLYESANNHLETAIIKLIDLEIGDTPDAVPAQPLDMIEMLFGDARGEHEFTSFEQAFKHFNRRALLLGEPGAGKTVTLMATARQAAADWLSDPTAHPLPVLGIIATWDASKQPPLTDWLGAQKGLTPDSLHGTKTLLLLDGLDELGGERTEERKDETTGEKIETRYDPRERFISALNAQLGENRALVTCRITDYEAIGQQAALDGAVTLQRLTDAQMRVYLADLPDLQAAIDADEGLREMARTPLLLSYLAFGFRDRPDDVKDLHNLSEGALRDAIFNAYMEKRYDREVKRLAKQGKEPPFTLDYIREVLGRLAMENAGGVWRRGKIGDMHKDNVLEQHDFTLVLPEDLIDAFITFCRDLHYLQQRSEGLGFIHVRLRDTLVYEYALPRLRKYDLYTIEYESNPAAAIGAIRDTRAVDPLILALGDAEVAIRYSAVAALELIGDARAVEPLISILADVDPDVRRSTADALGKLGSARAVDPLIYYGLTDDDGYVLRSAAAALVRLGEPAIGPLIRTLGDPDDNVRRRAANTLANLGELAIGPLSRALSDADVNVCRNAIDALGSLGAASAVEPLIHALVNKDWYVRGRAAKSLGTLGDARAAEPLIRLLTDTNAHVRKLAIFALLEISVPAIEPLIRALENGDRDVRHSAADALTRIGTPEALAAVRAWRKQERKRHGG